MRIMMALALLTVGCADHSTVSLPQRPMVAVTEPVIGRVDPADGTAVMEEEPGDVLVLHGPRAAKNGGAVGY